MEAGRKKSRHPTTTGIIIINRINLGLNVCKRIIALLTHTGINPFQHVSIIYTYIYTDYMEYILTKVASSAAVQPKQVIAFGCANLLNLLYN